MMRTDLEIKITSSPLVPGPTGDAADTALRFVLGRASGRAQRNARDLCWCAQFQHLPSADRPGILLKRKAGAGAASKKMCAEALKETAAVPR